MIYGRLRMVAQFPAISDISMQPVLRRPVLALGDQLQVGYGQNKGHGCEICGPTSPSGSEGLFIEPCELTVMLTKKCGGDL